MEPSTAAPGAHEIREPENVNLDDVDFSWQVARHFETDFLFAYGRLGPDLHNCFLQFQLLHSKTTDPVWARALGQALILCGTNLRIGLRKSRPGYLENR